MRQTEDEIRDVIIIGSGPAGYTAAIYAARAGLAPLVLTGSVGAGGALMNTTEVDNFPGFSKGITGPDLMAEMRAQAERFGAELKDQEMVEAELTTELKSVTDEDSVVHRGRTVILAMGSGYRRLGVPGEDRLSGRGVSWCATCDGFFFRGHEILVVGGGDSAVEEAVFLTKFADRVTMVHRRDGLRASRIMADRAHANSKIDFAWNSAVEELHGDTTLSGATLVDTVTGERRHVPATGVFVAIGHEPRSELVAGQVQLDEQGYVMVQGRSSHTSLPGVFACGDLLDHTYRQAITAAGSGCAAALDVERHLVALQDQALIGTTA